MPRGNVAPPRNTPFNTFGIGHRPKNWLVPVILLSLREWNSYGYELMERASAFGFKAMNPGTLYRTLRQMEKDGIVEYLRVDVLGEQKCRARMPEIMEPRAFATFCIPLQRPLPHS